MRCHGNRRDGNDCGRRSGNPLDETVTFYQRPRCGDGGNEYLE